MESIVVDAASFYRSHIGTRTLQERALAVCLAIFENSGLVPIQLTQPSIAKVILRHPKVVRRLYWKGILRTFLKVLPSIPAIDFLSLGMIEVRFVLRSDLLTRLKEVYFSEPYTDLSLLEKMPNLTSFLVSYNKISVRTAAKTIESLPRLNSIGIGLCPFAKEVGFLSKCTSLGRLEIIQCTQLCSLKGLPDKLRTLEVWAHRVSDLRPLSTLTDLRVLRLTKSVVLESLDGIGTLPIERLHVSHSRRLWNINALSGMTSLTALSATNCPMVSALNGTAIRFLQEVYLGKTAFKDLSVFKGSTSLKILAVDGCPINDIGPLTSCPNLIKLNVARTGIRSLEPLGNLMQLRVLNASSCSELDDIGPLTGLRLGALSLDGTLVSDLQPIRTMTSLQFLIPPDCLIPEALLHLRSLKIGSPGD